MPAVVRGKRRVYVNETSSDDNEDDGESSTEEEEVVIQARPKGKARALTVDAPPAAADYEDDYTHMYSSAVGEQDALAALLSQFGGQVDLETPLEPADGEENASRGIDPSQTWLDPALVRAPKQTRIDPLEDSSDEDSPKSDSSTSSRSSQEAPTPWRATAERIAIQARSLHPNGSSAGNHRVSHAGVETTRREALARRIAASHREEDLIADIALKPDLAPAFVLEDFVIFDEDLHYQPARWLTNVTVDRGGRQVMAIGYVFQMHEGEASEAPRVNDLRIRALGNAEGVEATLAVVGPIAFREFQALKGETRKDCRGFVSWIRTERCWFALGSPHSSYGRDYYADIIKISILSGLVLKALTKDPCMGMATFIASLENKSVPSADLTTYRREVGEEVLDWYMPNSLGQEQVDIPEDIQQSSLARHFVSALPPVSLGRRIRQRQRERKLGIFVPSLYACPFSGYARQSH